MVLLPARHGKTHSRLTALPQGPSRGGRDLEHMDGLTSFTPAARTRARNAVAGVTAFIGVAAVGGAGALTLGLGTSLAATATDDTGTTQAPQSVDQTSSGGQAQQSFGAPMATSGGS